MKTWIVEGVYDRALHVCERCGSREKLEIHHRLGKGRGGRLVEHELWTLVLLCNSRGGVGRGCHGDVHATSEQPWYVIGEIITDKIRRLPVYRGPDPEYQAAFPAAA